VILVHKVEVRAMAPKPAPGNDKLVYSVPEAGAKLGLGRNSSYAAAARGEIPTIRIGGLIKVPKVAIDRMIEKAGKRGAGNASD
jgi:excisionase family DNA binding protein